MKPQSIGNLKTVIEQIENEEYNNALLECYELLKVRPFHPEAILQIVDLYFRIGDDNNAKKYINKIFVKDGGWHFSNLKSPVDIEIKLKSYLHHRDFEVEKIKKKTLQTKMTSIVKLRELVEPYETPSKIPHNFLKDYVVWRRTKNWDRTKHINNPRPPSNLTINTELKDFKGFFDWCIEKKRFAKEIKYPFTKIDYKKSIEKNPSFTDEDWKKIVYYTRTWVKKDTTSKGMTRKNQFYRQVFVEFLKILSNSGMRVHEALLLKWSDIKLQKKVEIETKKDKDAEGQAPVNTDETTKTIEAPASK